MSVRLSQGKYAAEIKFTMNELKELKECLEALGPKGVDAASTLIKKSAFSFKQSYSLTSKAEQSIQLNEQSKVTTVFLPFIELTGPIPAGLMNLSSLEML